MIPLSWIIRGYIDYYLLHISEFSVGYIAFETFNYIMIVVNFNGYRDGLDMFGPIRYHKIICSSYSAVNAHNFQFGITHLLDLFYIVHEQNEQEIHI